MAVEIVDAYLPDGSLAGIDLVRGEPVPDGLLYPVGEVLVEHMDGSFLLMRRDLDKPIYPGQWEAGASGTVLKGETLEQGALRELWEETGLEADSLTEIGRHMPPGRNMLYVSFRYGYSGDKDAVRLQTGETIDYRWLSREAFLAFMETEEFVSVQRTRLLDTGYLQQRNG